MNKFNKFLILYILVLITLVQNVVCLDVNELGQQAGDKVSEIGQQAENKASESISNKIDQKITEGKDSIKRTFKEWVEKTWQECI